MPIKIHELAKELNITSKELLGKCQEIGVEAGSHMSSLNDEDALRLRNIFIKKKLQAETKIVKATPKKKDDTAKEDAPRVTVKAAVIMPAVSARSSRTKSATDDKTGARKPPIGKPIISKEVEGRPKAPAGKPVANKELDEREAKKAKELEAKKAQKLEKEAQIKEDKIIPLKDPKEIKVPEKPLAKTREKAHDKTPERAHDKAHDKASDRAHVKGHDKASDRAHVKGHDKASDRAHVKGHDKAPDRAETKTAPKKTGGEQKAVPVAPSKPGFRKDDRGKNKGRDKGDKTERFQDKRKKTNYVEIGSLEKAPKPKKHVRPVKEVDLEIENVDLPEGTVVINVPITVAGFSEQLEVQSSKIIMELMKLGIMATVNQNLDEDTVQLIGAALGINVVVGRISEEVVEEGIESDLDREDQLIARPPIITVMGHVDHGKTSLLDAIRKTNVTSGESGGITQHIGAYQIDVNGESIVFLDTPGHEAFTAMRARGAHVTDIAVLVVAADDSVMPQTLESISHAKAAGVPIIVAINKMDKPTANPDKVKKDLADKGVLVEDWGGDTISVPVSAKTGDGINILLEMILLQAEVLELKANPNRMASGTVLEARLDKAKGPVATLLVLNGSLQTGQAVVMGTSSGRIRVMTDYKGTVIKKAGPATAVEILGLADVPEAGDEFNAVKDLLKAKEIAANRKAKVREEVLARNASSSLEKLFTQLKEGEVKELNLIVKGDVQGSVDAIKTSLEKLVNENIRTHVVHSGVGTITESDIMLAGTVGAVILGFNVRPTSPIAQLAEREKIEIRSYRVIYDLIADVEAAMKGMLDPIYKEVLLGKAEVRETFKVPGVGIIAGSYVTEGKVVRNEQIRLLRDGIIIHEGKIASLKRIKDDAKEVREGFECGIGIENFNDIKIGDVIECFKMEEIER